MFPIGHKQDYGKTCKDFLLVQFYGWLIGSIIQSLDVEWSVDRAKRVHISVHFYFYFFFGWILRSWFYFVLFSFFLSFYLSFFLSFLVFFFFFFFLTFYFLSVFCFIFNFFVSLLLSLVFLLMCFSSGLACHNIVSSLVGGLFIYLFYIFIDSFINLFLLFKGYIFSFLSSFVFFAFLLFLCFFVSLSLNYFILNRGALSATVISKKMESATWVQILD